MNKTASHLIVFLFLFLLGTGAKGEANEKNEGTFKKETTILDLMVEPIDYIREIDGSDFISRRISGKIFLANNSCYAQGLSAYVKVHDGEHGVKEVKAFLLIDKDKHPKACIQIYDPVYQEFSVDVIGAKKIVIHNVDRLKNNVVLP